MCNMWHEWEGMGEVVAAEGDADAGQVDRLHAPV